MPLGLYGSARADALAMVDRRYNGKTLVIADLSNYATYAEPLFERLGSRLIGLRITNHGDGMTADRRQVKGGAILFYTIGRTYLIDLLLREMQSETVRILHGPASIRAYEQLMALEIEFRQSGMIYGFRQGGTMTWLSLPRCSYGRHNIRISSTGQEHWRGRGLYANEKRRVRQLGRDLRLTSCVAGETFGRTCLSSCRKEARPPADLIAAINRGRGNFC